MQANISKVWPSDLNPESREGRKYLKDRLIEFAIIANSAGTVTGLRSFYKSIPNQDIREQVLKWLEQYTPIRRSIVNARDLTFLVPKELKGTCNLDNAALTPWYSVLPTDNQQAKPPTQARQQKDGQRQLSDRQFKRKQLITAIDRFLTDPTESTKRKLIGAINSVPMEKSRRGGSVFLQGGATGLKK